MGDQLRASMVLLTNTAQFWLNSLQLCLFSEAERGSAFSDRDTVGDLQLSLSIAPAVSITSSWNLTVASVQYNDAMVHAHVGLAGKHCSLLSSCSSYALLPHASEAVSESLLLSGPLNTLLDGRSATGLTSMIELSSWTLQATLLLGLVSFAAASGDSDQIWYPSLTTSPTRESSVTNVLASICGCDDNLSVSMTPEQGKSWCAPTPEHMMQIISTETNESSFDTDSVTPEQGESWHSATTATYDGSVMSSAALQLLVSVLSERPGVMPRPETLGLVLCSLWYVSSIYNNLAEAWISPPVVATNALLF